MSKVNMGTAMIGTKRFQINEVPGPVVLSALELKSLLSQFFSAHNFGSPMVSSHGPNSSPH